LATKFWIRADGEFVLRIFGLRFDNVFVYAFLNAEFVVGHNPTDRFVRRFRQQVREEEVPGVQALSLIQGGKAIRQQILDIKRP